MVKILSISNEADAWNAIFKITEHLEDDKEFDIKIEAWPDFHFVLCGPEFKGGTFTADSVKFVEEVQKSFYRSYAIARYGISNVAYLTNTERELLKLSFKVDEGSADFVIKYLKALKNLPDFFEDLRPEQKYKLSMRALLIVAVLYAGDTGYSTWLENKRLERLDAAQHRETMEMLSTIRFATEGQIEVMDKVIEMAKENTSLAKIIAENDAVNETFLKTAKKAQTANISGNSLKKPVAEELTRKTREKPEEVRLDGNYRVTQISDPEKGSSEFRVSLVKSSSDDTLTSVLDTSTVPPLQKSRIFTALEEGRVIYLKVNARISRGKVINAFIMEAYFPEDVESAAGD